MNDAGEQYAQQIEAARLAMGRGDRAVAERLLSEAIAIVERQVGAEHPSLGVALNELSRLHIRQSDFARAEPVLQRLLQVTLIKGERHPDVATALAGLAAAKRGLGDDAAAENLYRRALRIREQALAPNHMAIVVTLEQLSDTCAARGKFAEALVHLERALMRRESAFGAEHATVRGLRTRIAGLERRHAEWTARAAERATAPSTPVIEAGITRPAPTTQVETAAPSDVSPKATADRSATQAAPVQLPRRASRRTSRYASGLAAVFVLAVAGFAFRSPSGNGSENAGVGALVRMAVGRVASVSSAPATAGSSGEVPIVHHDSNSVATASGAYEDSRAGDTQPTLASGGAPTTPVVSVALPRLRKLVVPSVAMPSLDSVLRNAVNVERDGSAESIGAAAGLRTSSYDDDGSVRPPVPIGPTPIPRYPGELHTQRLEGEVVVRFRVDERGRVDASSMQVQQSPHPLFTEAVRNVLPRFRFEPARSGAPGSKPQAAWVQFRTQFTARQ